MYYRPREKKRHPLITLLSSLLLLAATGVLAYLVAVYLGYIDFEPPALAEQFAPTPTPTPSPLLVIAEGDLAFAQGDLQLAIDKYEQAIRSDPTLDIPYARQARLLIFTGNTAKAVERATQAVILNPDSPENLAHYCRALDWEARYAEALDACSCAVELNPNYAEGYAFLAEVYADLGNWRLAESNARKAIELNYQSMDAHHNMGYTLEVQGRYREAAEFYENAIKLAPNLAPLHMDAGRLYQHGLGDYEQAIKHFKQAVKLRPFDPEPYDLLGWAFYQNGEYVRAIEAFEQSISLDPNYVNPFRRETAWGHLGTLYYTRQNFEKSIEYLKKAVELGEKEFIRRARQIEIYTEIDTLTGPQTVPVLRGSFVSDKPPAYQAELRPIVYSTGGVEFDTELTCGQLLKQSLQAETVLLNSTQVITLTQTFTHATGTATLNPEANLLTLDISHLPQPPRTPYEIQVTFWPNRTDSVGYFQPDSAGRAQVNIQFEEKLVAPIEYYYEIGLAYAYLDPPQCEQAIPWLLKSLEIDRSPYSPAWAGLRICPSPNAPPTPIPTPTPLPTPAGQ
ncbi:MAG: tetratricopeptide repeat protein [Chloroflexi bacterium]|nr:MAG: tetratricopeptide repeat protein [Chloroflexota bacterium]